MKRRFVVVLVTGVVQLASCGRYDRAIQARDAEIARLQHETFAQVLARDTEDDRCAHGACVRQEAGFAYAKANRITNPDACFRKGDDAFVEGCQQYAEDVEKAYLRIAGEG